MPGLSIFTAMKTEGLNLLKSGKYPNTALVRRIAAESGNFKRGHRRGTVKVPLLKE